MSYSGSDAYPTGNNNNDNNNSYYTTYAVAYSADNRYSQAPSDVQSSSHNATSYPPPQPERQQTIQELSQDVKNHKLQQGSRGFRIPIVAALLTQLIIAVAVVAIPLSYISLNNASKITTDLTATIITSTIQQTSDRLISFFTQFSNSVILVSSFPQIPYLEDCCINDMSAGNVNLTTQMVRVLQQNPLSSGVEVHFHTNASLPIIPAGPRYLLLQDPCSFFNLPINGTCYVRARTDQGVQGALTGRLINPVTGVDISPDVNLIEAGKIPIPKLYTDWDQYEIDPNWGLLYVTGKFSRWSVLFGKGFVHKIPGSDKVYSTLSVGYLPCEVTLVQYFLELLPTPASSIWFVDDTGYMVASTINGSVSLNDTRYTPTQNPNGLISSISQYVEANIAPFNQPLKFPNQTSQFVNVAGTTYILATKTIYLPVSSQKYQLVLVVPRQDFYGSTDNAFKLSIITGSAIGGVGLIMVAGLAYFASLPLKRLSNAMARLTKFDFTVLENGNLDHRSTISELQEVERTFLMMVMAFAAGIRRNKELLMGRSNTSQLQSNSGGGSKI